MRVAKVAKIQIAAIQNSNRLTRMSMLMFKIELSLSSLSCSSIASSFNVLVICGIVICGEGFRVGLTIGSSVFVGSIPETALCLSLSFDVVGREAFAMGLIVGCDVGQSEGENVGMYVGVAFSDGWRVGLVDDCVEFSDD